MLPVAIFPKVNTLIFCILLLFCNIESTNKHENKSNISISLTDTENLAIQYSVILICPYLPFSCSVSVHLLNMIKMYVFWSNVDFDFLDINILIYYVFTTIRLFKPNQILLSILLTLLHYTKILWKVYYILPIVAVQLLISAIHFSFISISFYYVL